MFASKIIEQKKEVLLHQSEKRYMTLFHEMIDGFALHEIILDTDGMPVDYRFIAVNPAFEHLTGLKAKHIVNRTVLEVMPDIDRHWIDTYGRVALSGEPVSFENYSTPLVKHFKVTAFRVEKGQFACIFQNITERKNAEEEIKEYANRLELAMEAANMAWWEMYVDSGKVNFNSKKAEMLGYSSEQFNHYEDFTKLVHPADYEPMMTSMRALLDGTEKKYDIEYRIKAQSGEYRWFHDIGTITQRAGDGKPLKVSGIVIHFTGRKLAEEEIQKQLSEKEILLREVHHRVKNNIATIEGFLSLQEDSTDNFEVKKAIKGAISRVQSMRILYDKLLVSKDLSEISMKNYVEDLIDSLQNVFVGKDNIIIEKQISEFGILSKQAITTGIITNELLTNVFKYAFKDRDKGTVSVSIEKTEKMVTIIIQDNGIGIDKRIMENKSLGFGLTIVKMLIEQLDGTFSIVNENGTKSVIQFEV